MAEVFKCAYTEIVDIHKLVKNPKNPNQHPQDQIEMLAKIIDYQGQRSPIVVSNRSGFVIKGHGRLLALHRLGWTKAAVDYQDYENEAQEFADLIADNKIAELSIHDDRKMIEEIGKFDDLNLEMLGIKNLIFNDNEDAGFDPSESDGLPEEKSSKSCPHCGGSI